MSRAVACLLVILCCLAARAAEAQRVALVVGNSAYRHTTALVNPANDARDVAAALRAIGFQVTEALDLDRRGFLDAMRAFSAAADRAELALFFYAGHAVQAPTLDRRRTQNWLLPIDAQLAHEADMEDEAVSLDSVLARMAGARARVVLLDACRDNPMAERMLRTDRTRGGLPRGLGRTGPLPSGSLVAFATASGETAADGRGRNSPFTEGLLRHINTPGVDVGEMLQDVRRTVEASTTPPQRPDIDNQLSGRITLVQAPPAAAPTQPAVPTPPVPPPGAPTVPSEALDLAFWTSIQNSRDPRDFEAYLLTYPQGRFAALARIRIEQLRTAAAPVPTPPPPADPPADARSRAEIEEARRLAEELRRQQEALARQQEELARQREEIRRATEQREREAAARAEAEARERNRALELERQRRAEQERVERERQQAEAERLERERRAAARMSNEQTEAALNMSVANWTWVQERLAALGHNIGGVDGVVGPRTRAAIRAFQSANGFADSGFLNQALVDLLDQQGTPAMQRAERGRREAEERTRRDAEERQRRETDERARARARAVALAWNSAGAWATRAADTIEAARDAALRACNEARGATDACVLANHFIPANTRRCLVLHRNGNRLFVSTAATMEETRNTNIAFCQRESGSGCAEAYAWCGEPR